MTDISEDKVKDIPLIVGKRPAENDAKYSIPEELITALQLDAIKEDESHIDFEDSESDDDIPIETSTYTSKKSTVENNEPCSSTPVITKKEDVRKQSRGMSLASTYTLEKLSNRRSSIDVLKRLESGDIDFEDAAEMDKLLRHPRIQGEACDDCDNDSAVHRINYAMEVESPQNLRKINKRKLYKARFLGFFYNKNDKNRQLDKADQLPSVVLPAKDLLKQANVVQRRMEVDHKNRLIEANVIEEEKGLPHFSKDQYFINCGDDVLKIKRSVWRQPEKSICVYIDPHETFNKPFTTCCDSHEDSKANLTGFSSKLMSHRDRFSWLAGIDDVYSGDVEFQKNVEKSLADVLKNAEKHKNKDYAHILECDKCQENFHLGRKTPQMYDLMPLSKKNGSFYFRFDLVHARPRFVITDRLFKYYYHCLSTREKYDLLRGCYNMSVAYNLMHCTLQIPLGPWRKDLYGSFYCYLLVPDVVHYLQVFEEQRDLEVIPSWFHRSFITKYWKIEWPNLLLESETPTIYQKTVVNNFNRDMKGNILPEIAVTRKKPLNMETVQAYNNLASQALEVYRGFMIVPHEKFGLLGFASECDMEFLEDRFAVLEAMYSFVRERINTEERSKLNKPEMACTVNVNLEHGYIFKGFPYVFGFINFGTKSKYFRKLQNTHKEINDRLQMVEVTHDDIDNMSLSDEKQDGSSSDSANPRDIRATQGSRQFCDIL